MMLGILKTLSGWGETASWDSQLRDDKRSSWEIAFDLQNFQSQSPIIWPVHPSGHVPFPVLIFSGLGIRQLGSTRTALSPSKLFN